MSEDDKIRICAEAAHELNRVWCRAHGDDSQKLWADADVELKASVIDGVKGVLAGNTPRQSHESWLKFKEAAGWKYGPVKNVDQKEHPCFVPYDQLSPTNKAKDFLFVNTVKTTWEALSGVRAGA